MFTRAVIDGISRQIGKEIPPANISGLVAPMVLGDVTILPINAFGAGQQHSNSEPRGGLSEKLFHHFRGSWLADQEGS